MRRLGVALLIAGLAGSACVSRPWDPEELSALAARAQAVRTAQESFEELVRRDLVDVPQTARRRVQRRAYYDREYLDFAPIDPAERSGRVAALIEALQISSVRSLEYRDARAGGRWAPPWKGSFGYVPTPVLHALATLIERQRYGAELDAIVPVRLGGTGRRVTIWYGSDGHVVAASYPLQDLPPVAGGLDAATQIEQRYGVGPIVAGSRSWRRSELAALDQALSLLDNRELALLRGLTFRRDERWRDSNGERAGYYTAHFEGESAPTREIQIFDGAFKADGIAFVGSLERPYAPSVLVILHEIGHALAGARHFALTETYAQRASEAREVAEAYNRLGRRVPLREIGRMQGVHRNLERIRGALLAAGNVLERGAERGRVLAAFAAIPGAVDGPTEYARTSPGEAFAESFALFRVDPPALGRVAPAVHAFFFAGGHLAAPRP